MEILDSTVEDTLNSYQFMESSETQFISVASASMQNSATQVAASTGTIPPFSVRLWNTSKRDATLFIGGSPNNRRDARTENENVYGAKMESRDAV